MAQGKTIKNIYSSKGLKAPKGKGEHTVKFHKIASAILKSESKDGITNKEKKIAYATAMKKLGRNKAVNKSHRK
jgi:hypothetical protein